MTTPTIQPAGAGETTPIGGANYLLELVAYGKSKNLDFVKANIHELDAIQTELIDSMRDTIAALRAELDKARDYESEVTETLVKQEAELDAAKAEIVALREELQSVSVTFNPVLADTEWGKAVKKTHDLLARTSTSYAHLVTIDREALRKTVEALTEVKSAYDNECSDDAKSQLRLEDAVDNCCAARALLRAHGVSTKETAALNAEDAK
jgi:hypothetical protein